MTHMGGATAGVSLNNGQSAAKMLHFSEDRFFLLSFSWGLSTWQERTRGQTILNISEVVSKYLVTPQGISLPWAGPGSSQAHGLLLRSSSFGSTRHRGRKQQCEVIPTIPAQNKFGPKQDRKALLQGAKRSIRRSLIKLAPARCWE